MQPPTQDTLRGIELPPRAARARAFVPTPALHAVRAGVRQFGVVTADLRPLPDFVIIGAKKAGTSSLLNWLLRHSATARLFPSAQRLKSPHYFDINYWRGPQWYRSHFPTRSARRRQERRTGALTVVGEASPYYLFHPAVPGRVAATLPEVRVIVLLREPVSRAYSNYFDRRAFGAEDLPTFEQAIDAEEQRLGGVDQERLRTDPRYYSADHDHHSYLARGRYTEHLRAWLEVVPLERMLVLCFEDLLADPHGLFTTVQEFLRLPVTDAMRLGRYNARPQPPMDPGTRRRLADYYRPHNAELYDLLGRDLGWDRHHTS